MLTRFQGQARYRSTYAHRPPYAMTETQVTLQLLSQAVTAYDEHRKFPFNECVFAAAIIIVRCLTEAAIREVQKIRHKAVAADSFTQRKLTSGKPSMGKYHFQIVPLRPISGWSVIEKVTIRGLKFSNGEDCITFLRVMAPHNLTCKYK